MFFLILLSKFLLPSTSPKININAVMYTRDMTTINDFDWFVVVYENFRLAITEWKEKLLPLRSWG